MRRCLVKLGRCRLLVGIAFVFLVLLSAPAAANITISEYMTLRVQAQSGNKSAEARWRYYIIGLMDGIQAVQAPAAAAGTQLHFCMPDTLPLSPKFLDDFIQEAIGRRAADASLKATAGQPMAVLVALELRRAYPCP